MAAIGTDMKEDSAVTGNSMVKVDSMENGDSMEKGSAAGPLYAAVAESIVSHRHMAEAVSAVAAGPTEEAAGSGFSIFLSQLNGWQLRLPAVCIFNRHNFNKKFKSWSRGIITTAARFKENFHLLRVDLIAANVVASGSNSD
jgi:hypothetical protein